MTPVGNAREYAGGFAFRRPMEIDETTAGLRDLIPLRTTVSELLRQELERICDEQSPATDAVLAKLQDVTDADAEWYQDLTAQLASTLGCGGE